MEVWRASQEGLNVVIVNPGVILGAGIWRYGSAGLFKKAHKGMKYYTSGSIGLVDVQDVVSVMILLTKSSIKNERFILIAENWNYKEFLQNMSRSVNTSPPEKMASPLLLQIAWRLDWLNHKLRGKRRQLTRQLVISLSSDKSYDNTKIKTYIDFEFKKVNDSIIEIGQLYLKQAQ